MAETRVGFVTIDVLRQMAIEYIEAHTSHGHYGGDPCYLTMIQVCTQFLHGTERTARAPNPADLTGSFRELCEDGTRAGALSSLTGKKEPGSAPGSHS